MAIKRGFHKKTQFTPDKKCEENPQAIPISQVKRVKRETASTSDSAQFILAWRSEDSVEKLKKPPSEAQPDDDSSAILGAAQSRRQAPNRDSVN